MLSYLRTRPEVCSLQVLNIGGKAHSLGPPGLLDVWASSSRRSSSLQGTPGVRACRSSAPPTVDPSQPTLLTLHQAQRENQLLLREHRGPEWHPGGLDGPATHIALPRKRRAAAHTWPVALGPTRDTVLLWVCLPTCLSTAPPHLVRRGPSTHALFLHRINTISPPRSESSSKPS